MSMRGLLSRLRRRGIREGLERIPCAIPAPLRGRRHLVATKRGLFHVSGAGLFRLLAGQFYGLTADGDHWYAFERRGDRGRILRFELEETRMKGLREVVTGLSGGCHQIDYIGDRLWVTETYENRLLVFRPTDAGLVRVAEQAPAGRLARGRDSHNYVHMNSLWMGEDGLHVIFHNETEKTGRRSEIVRLAGDGKIVERIATASTNAHNIVRYRGRLLHCDSQGSALCWGEDIVFRADLFTRGLSLSGDLIVVGGSAYARREARERLGGALYVLDADFRELARMEFPAMVQEIRALDEPDLTLSNAVKTTDEAW